MYQYVIRIEDELAQQAGTSEEFMGLLVKHAPHQQAAEHFHLSFGQFMVSMREIEEEIQQRLDTQIDRIKWLDCTPLMRQKRSAADHMKYFYFNIG
ncbi:hypothetical protein KH172YL63_01730 [Bacillus sp. KH172YL63]|nr:hypothetical protein KH172YL63_01730 [Bacillus sp. KH172YL63]